MLPKQENLIIPMLEILSKFPNGVRNTTVYSRLAEYYPKTTSEDRKLPQGDKGDTVWENNIRFARAKAVERKLMVSGSPVGLWQLTRNGYMYLQQRINDWNPAYREAKMTEPKAEEKVEKKAKYKFTTGDLVDNAHEFSESLLKVLLKDNPSRSSCPFCNVTITDANTHAEFEEPGDDDAGMSIYRTIHCKCCGGVYTLHMMPVDLMVSKAPILKPTVEVSELAIQHLSEKLKTNVAVDTAIKGNKPELALARSIGALMNLGYLYPRALVAALKYLGGSLG